MPPRVTIHLTEREVDAISNASRECCETGDDLAPWQRALLRVESKAIRAWQEKQERIK